VSALSSWTELAVGAACLAGAWAAWRRAERIAGVGLAIAGAVAVVHAAVALAG
jgi:hypothetical protein